MLLLSSSIFYFLANWKEEIIIFVNYICKNTIIFIIIITTFDISVPLTSEMIATPLPCNITEYKTLAICRVIFIWASNILWLQVNFIR